ncbi:MAG: outer membrane beta-barrel family protein [Clostridiales bacterium]|nr:outer membrane beta-barrel family protein [Clostridiales bacterium]
MTRLTILTSAIVMSIVSMSARSINGEVRSDSDSTVVVGAICRLMSGSQFINGVNTDRDGKFDISTNLKSKLTLEISMAGFNTTEIVIESDKNIDVGTVYLSEGVVLDEVQVTANSMIDAKGRTVIFPSGSDIKASSTSIGLFQKLPLAGLEANPINRTLTVDGGTPVILINGVPSSIDDFNALQPKDIAKIEFSRITPARYADRGNSGFLNITLKTRNDGGEVYVWGRSAVNTAFVDGNARASYHQGPSQFTLTYSPSWRNYKQVFDNTTESYIGNDFSVNLEEHDRNPFNYQYHNIGLKYDYSPVANTLFSATFLMTPSTNKSRSLATTIDSYLGDYKNSNLSTSRNLAPSLDLFFKRDFNERNSLEVQVVGTLSSSDYRRNNEYAYADGSTDHYTMDVDSRRRSLISEISYTHSFSDKTSLSAGYQNTVSHSTNTYLTSDYKPILTENNNYVYARLGQQLGKVYISLATGAKLYWIRNDINKRHFIRNLTTAQISWNISRQWSLSGSFQYTPSIPSLSALTDYPQQQSPYLISNGNPALKVSQNFRYQLMPSYQYKKFSASLLMTYRHVGDFVMSDMFYMGDKMFLSQSINARKSWYAGANLNLKLNDIYGFGANVNVGLDRYETMGDNWCHHLTSVDASFSLWWNKGPYTISYWRKIPGKYLSGNYVGKDENGDTLGFEYQPDRHWTFGASWMYMFDKKGTKYPAWGFSSVNPYYRERYIKNNGNMVVLSISYSADFGSIFRSSRRSLNNSDNGSSLLKL